VVGYDEVKVASICSFIVFDLNFVCITPLIGRLSLLATAIVIPVGFIFRF